MSQSLINVTNVQVILVPVPLSARLSHIDGGQSRLPWSLLGSLSIRWEQGRFLWSLLDLHTDGEQGRLPWSLLGSYLTWMKALHVPLVTAGISLGWGDKAGSLGLCWACK